MGQDLRERPPLTAPFPEDWVEQFKQGGETLDFVPWHRYVKRLEEDGYTWQSRVTTVDTAGSQLLMVVSVSIKHEGEGWITHEGTGAADADKTSWGGAHAEAYSQAFRRACAHHGLGLYFYEGEDDVRSGGGSGRGKPADHPYGHSSGEEGQAPTQTASPPTEKQQERLRQLARSGVFSETEADKWREQLADNWTKSGAGIILRQMKDEYKERTGEDFTPPEDEMS